MTRTAIATENGQVSEHFGRCPEYTLIDMENGSIATQTVVANPGHQPGVIPRFLNSHDVDAIVCGGIGARAMQLFDEFGIAVIAGVTGPVGDVVGRLAAGTLEGGESLCTHDEGDEHHGECSHQ